MVNFALWLLWIDCCSPAQCSSGLSTVSQFSSGVGCSALMMIWEQTSFCGFSMSSCFHLKLQYLEAWKNSKDTPAAVSCFVVFMSGCAQVTAASEWYPKNMKVGGWALKRRLHQNPLITGSQCINLVVVCNSIQHLQHCSLSLLPFCLIPFSLPFSSPTFHHEVVLASFLFQSASCWNGSCQQRNSILAVFLVSSNIDQPGVEVTEEKLGWQLNAWPASGSVRMKSVVNLSSKFNNS